MKTVERGVALLDERMPGWDEKIDLVTLDLGSSCNCVVAQLHKKPRERYKFKRYDRGLKVLEIEDGEADRFGFTVWPGGRFENLTTAWRRLIKRRRKERAA